LNCKPFLKTLNYYYCDSMEELIRVRTPKGREVIGVVEEMVGGNKMMIRCTDGKMRLCRIPGRMRRRIWVRSGYYVLVEPWKIQDNKGDIIFSYKKSHINWLRKRGFLQGLES